MIEVGALVWDCATGRTGIVIDILELGTDCGDGVLRTAYELLYDDSEIGIAVQGELDVLRSSWKQLVTSRRIG